MNTLKYDLFDQTEEQIKPLSVFAVLSDPVAVCLSSDLEDRTLTSGVSCCSECPAVGQKSDAVCYPENKELRQISNFACIWMEKKKKKGVFSGLTTASSSTSRFLFLAFSLMISSCSCSFFIFSSPRFLLSNSSFLCRSSSRCTAWSHQRSTGFAQ